LWRAATCPRDRRPGGAGNTELLQRLRTIPELSPQVAELAESFISRYRTARFGGKETSLSELQSLPHAIEASVTEG
jgi:hypothetical protein